MHGVSITDGAKADMLEVFQKDPDAGGILMALLDEIDQQDIPPDVLLQKYEKDGDFGNFTVRFCLQIFDVDGLKIWALKTFWNADKDENREKREPLEYRILFAPVYAEDRYLVLGVLHRKNCYEPKGKKYARIRQDYTDRRCNQSGA